MDTLGTSSAAAHGHQGHLSHQSHQGHPRRPRRGRASAATRAVVVLASASLALAGCSAVPRTGGADGGQDQSVPAVELAAAQPTPQVIDGGARDSALAVSKALFSASPVVVVATEGTVKAAARKAVDLQVPLLVAGKSGITAELDRLGADAVVVFGKQSGGWEDVVGDRQVIDGADPDADVPDFRTADEAADTDTEADTDADPDAAEDGAVVLVPDDAGKATAAAVATAKAAGAVVRTVANPDPRASAEIVKVLHAHRDATVLGLGDGFADAKTFGRHVAVASTAPQLPGGGQLVFPGRRMVALYGHPGTASLGALGEQGVDGAIKRVKKLAAQYDPYSKQPVVPAFEIIATVASAAAGADGDYSNESPVEQIEPWIDAAAKAGVYVVLDLQPGRTDFLTQAKRYKSLLKRPNVGLALDPEWRLGPTQHHMVQIGSVDAAEINEVSDWLASLVRENHLPQKVLLLHQFSRSMIVNRDRVDLGHDELAVVVHADGNGTPPMKQETYRVLQNGIDSRIWMGWKNFYDEDTPTFTPKRTYTKVDPKPWFVSYQ